MVCIYIYIYRERERSVQVRPLFVLWILVLEIFRVPNSEKKKTRAFLFFPLLLPSVVFHRPPKGDPKRRTKKGYPQVDSKAPSSEVLKTSRALGTTYQFKRIVHQTLDGNTTANLYTVNPQTENPQAKDL